MILAAGCGSAAPRGDDDAPPPSARPIAQEMLHAGQDAPPPPPPDPRSPNRVLGYVEGEVVTYREVMQEAGPALAQLADNPEQRRQVEERTTMDIVLRRLMYRAAVDQGVKASRDDIDAERAEHVKDLAKNGGSLEAYLREHDMTRREFDEEIRTDLVITKFRRAAIGRNNDPEVHVRPTTDIYVSPDEVEKYYERHPEKFQVPATARCRMLAVKTDLDAKDREAAVAEARAKAEAIRARLAAGEDWVPVYRDAVRGAEIVDPNDGLFDMRRGEKADWIEEFAFKSQKGVLSELIPKGTTFYILQAEGAHEARTKPFEEAAPDIRRMLFDMSAARSWIDVELTVLDESSIQPESLRTSLRDALRSQRRKLLADGGAGAR